MFDLIYKKRPIKKLIYGKKNIDGRNNTGKVMLYHRGGGCKKKFRIIDFKRFIWNIPAFIKRIEYDPNRNALISLVSYSNGIISYIIATEGLKVGDIIWSGEEVPLKTGNCTFVKNIPVGMKISLLEFNINGGAQFVRSAGLYAKIVNKLANFVTVKLRSGETRRFFPSCLATISPVSNFHFRYKNFRRAGYFRLKGWRPVVRGVAMNPVDHPHGGGEGKTSGGRPSVTPWGVITKGKPTVTVRSRFVVKSRKFQK